MRLILIRHGVTEWNELGRYQGNLDVPLSEPGRAQARRLSARLQGETIDAAFTSDLQRARETAALALDGQETLLEATADLREIRFGDWEGLTHTEIAARYPSEWAAWVSEPTRAVPPGSDENLTGLRARLVSFLDRIEKGMRVDSTLDDPFGYQVAGRATVRSEQQTILVVSHGGPIRALLTHLFDMPVERYWQFGIRPASVSIVDTYREGAIAEVIGDTSHLVGPE